MWHLLDLILVSILVSLSALYIVYALGSMRVKRRMLELLIRCCGLRVYALFSPRAGSCSHCPAELQKRNLVRQFRRSGAHNGKST